MVSLARSNGPDARAHTSSQRSGTVDGTARTQSRSAEELSVVEPNRRAVSSGIGGMTQRPLRVLLIGTHPVQYSSPMFRLYANDPRLEIQVAYCSLQGAEAEFDRDFGVEVKWDVPLLEGYPWVEVPNRSWSPG